MNQIDLTHRNAIVTGGARGIGHAIATRLLQSGARVSLWDVDAAALAEAANGLKSLGQVHTTVVDVTSAASAAAAATATAQAFGKLDILVNNAGVAGHNAHAWETDPAEWRRVLDINLTGPFHCCHAVIPHLLRNHYGRIVNIASIAGKDGNPGTGAYSASKAAVIALTKSLGKELALHGITANAVTPATVLTDLVLEQRSEEHRRTMVGRSPMGRYGTVDEVAAMVAWIASEAASFSTGAVFDVSGGRATY